MRCHSAFPGSDITRGSGTEEDGGVCIMVCVLPDISRTLMVSPPRRYEKQLGHEEQSLQEQRRRLYSEVSEEKERLKQQAAR